MERLKKILANVGKLDDREIRTTVENVEEKIYPKGSILVKEGSYSKAIYFVSQGFLRTYQLIDGKEKSLSFAQPGKFISSINGNDLQAPSEVFIETLTQATVATLDAEKLEYLKHKIPKISYLMNIMFKEILECKERRINEFINLSSKDRYRNFVVENPELIKVLSVNNLSSYLGVAPETISRIRSKVIF